MISATTTELLDRGNCTALKTKDLCAFGKECSYNFLIKSFLSLCSFIFLLCVTSCGYQAGYDAPECIGGSSISVPFICGDVDGQLTAAVIKEIATSSPYTYTSSCGDLILQAKLLELRDDNVGFRYDLTNKGKLTKSIIPTETRLSAVVEVCLVNAASGAAVLGPGRIKGFVDFDHEYESSRNSINVSSLGQLSDYDDAYDEAMVPLNRKLARKIVDFITDG